MPHFNSKHIFICVYFLLISYCIIQPTFLPGFVVFLNFLIFTSLVLFNSPILSQQFHATTETNSIKVIESDHHNDTDVQHEIKDDQENDDKHAGQDTTIQRSNNVVDFKQHSKQSISEQLAYEKRLEIINKFLPEVVKVLTIQVNMVQRKMSEEVILLMESFNALIDIIHSHKVKIQNTFDQAGIDSGEFNKNIDQINNLSNMISDFLKESNISSNEASHDEHFNKLVSHIDTTTDNVSDKLNTIVSSIKEISESNTSAHLRVTVALEAFQFEDRLSQILGNISKTLSTLEDKIHDIAHQQSKQAYDVDQLINEWLDEIGDSFTTSDERKAAKINRADDAEDGELIFF